MAPRLWSCPTSSGHVVSDTHLKLIKKAAHRWCAVRTFYLNDEPVHFYLSSILFAYGPVKLPGVLPGGPDGPVELTGGPGGTASVTGTFVGDEAPVVADTAMIS